jgi:hypothetical protein
LHCTDRKLLRKKRGTKKYLGIFLSIRASTQLPQKILNYKKKKKNPESSSKENTNKVPE